MTHSLLKFFHFILKPSVDPRNPTIATNSKNLSGYICTQCQKGILLMDMDCVRY